MDLHSPKRLAVEGPEVRSVAGHKHLTAELYRRGQHGTIFFGQRTHGLSFRNTRLDLRHVYSRDQAVENRQAVGRLQREVAARLLHDIGIGVALVPGLGNKREQSRSCAA